MFRHKTLLSFWKQIVLVGLVGAAISAGVTLLFPLEYRADAQVLIISRDRTGVDPYTVVKSAERVGENLAQIMRTSDFFEKVREEGGSTLDLSRFENVSERVRRERWSKMVGGSVSYGTGVLTVSAYHPDSAQAIRFASAATDALVKKGWEYVGGDVTIKQVNAPVVTQYPVRPNLVLNVIAGFIVGIVLGGVLVLARKTSWHVT